MIERLPDGPAQPAWADLAWWSQELSSASGRKLALSRGYMRVAPLLMVLDEPTAALDAETEHELFERYADAARATQSPLAESRSWSRTGSAPYGWPISSSCSTARGLPRSAVTRS